MNELQIFTYNDTEIRTVEKDDGLWWVAKDVCEVFGETNRNRAMQALDKDEKGYTQIDTPGGKQQMAIVNEPGLYALLFAMQPEKARGVDDDYIETRAKALKDFKRWVTHEVLPSIRKTGEYKTPRKAMTDYQQMMADTRMRNARIQSARILTQLAKQYEGTTYEQVLNAHATKELTGEYLLPLPKLEAKTYSAAEVGEILGISGQMVGILANRHGLKTNQYGSLFNDKSKYSNKEVQTFRYYESVIPVLRALVEKSA